MKTSRIKFAAIWCCIVELVASASDPSSMAVDNIQKPIDFEQGWAILQGAVDRVINVVEGIDNNPFTADEYIEYYTIVYDLGGPGRGSYENSKKLYDLYRKAFEDYITLKVLPSLLGKKDEILLQELERRWQNQKTMTYWLSRFFGYLDRYFTTIQKQPSLREISSLSFYDLVFGKINSQIRGAAISMIAIQIDREREGEQIHQVIVKNVVAIYTEIGKDLMNYTRDFEDDLAKHTAAFYSQKASNWITSEPYKEYMLKVEDCLKHERDRISYYLPAGLQKKLLEVVQHELLSVYASELQEKKQLDEVLLNVESYYVG
ncbi:cullin-1 isoform X1 [Ziziphus jujuba]|uniref:Cullin-1 isoform X1 n=1 Tax=Ziziphus jujuba TaxID=326968 RepID=A0ABM3ZVM8_ZIZJJ|nr:cullin-1 isoform X1 [Ziziphus jujuba]